MKKKLVLALAAVSIILLSFASLSIGSGKAGMSDVWPALFDYDGSATHVIIEQMRLPRTLIAILAGVAFGIAGALAQSLTRNALGDPGVLGVNAGAAFAVAVVIAFTGVAAPSGFIWWALIGSAVIMSLVYVIGSAGNEGTAVVRITLTGVALGAVLAGATTALTIIFPTAFAKLRDWNTGSIANTDMSVVTTVAPLVLAGLVLTLEIMRSLDLLAAGDATAVSLGVKVKRTTALSVAAIALLAGSATAAAGPILFFGLMVPHIAKRLLGTSLAWTVAGSALIGPAIFLASDIIARIVLPSGELPVGLVTAALGAPLLIVLARRSFGSAAA